MSNIRFPTNPENGMIFEAIPGLFYKYNAGSNSWIRLKGVESLGLATPLSDGLMSKEDFSKLQDLIIPPPQATLKGEECNTTFRSGTVGLYSFDESLEVSKNPKVINTSSTGTVDATGPWQLHKNTAGFDFRVPIDKIVEEIEDRNQLKKIQLQGDKGYKGKRGEAGRDRLDTGPVGETGPVGVNSPFGGTLTTENIPFELAPGNANRAVVDITTEEVSEDENYLVVTRANIGNPDACPALVTPQDFNSALVVALNTIAGGKLVRDQTITSGDCALICRICSSNIHHLNIEDIVCAIHDQFIIRVNQLKLEKEELVRAWLTTMINLFNEQKAALCCALENCRSRQRNERTRQYIETQRIQAALGDFSLLIDGAENRQATDMDAYKDCPVPQSAISNVEIDGDCVIATLDAKIHTIDPRSNLNTPTVSTHLQAGSYTAEVTSCCANFNDSSNSPAYSGRVALLYNANTSVGTGDEQRTNVSQQVLTFPDFGTFNNESAAKNAYQGVTLTFDHYGGDIAVWLLDSDGFNSNNSGEVQVTIKPVEATDATAPEASGIIYVYRDEITFDGFLGRIVPFAGGISAAENLGSLEDDVDLTFGPSLVKDRAQMFFYDGTDGHSLFFVAGAQPASGNDQSANILLDVNITNNPYVTSLRGNTASADVKQIAASQYQSTVDIDGNSAGFVIGELDLDSDFSIEIDPNDLSTMRQFVAADADANNILLAEGGSEGIGGNIALIADNTAPLYRVSDVPDGFGGGNIYGMRIDNSVSGQSVYVTRPIDIDVNAVFDMPASIDIPKPGVEFPSTPESEVIKTRDENMSSNNWDGETLSSGRAGIGSLSSRTSGGNPGSYRQITHSVGTEQRRIVSTGRPTSAYFGPGSIPALPWDQSYATDQFGNVWVFIRDVSGSPSKNGNGDTFIRDAVAGETWVSQTYPNRIAANIFPGGSSGIASGTMATGDVSPTSGVVTTFDIFQGISYTPAELGELYALSLNLDVLAGGSFEIGVALSQNGNTYASTKTTAVNAGDWRSIGVNGGAASNFGLVGAGGSIDLNSNPDFSSADLILFGYYIKSIHTSVGAEDRTIGIDNWTICLTVPPGTPEIPITDIPKSITDEKGEFVDEEASSLPRGATGSPQDPCIADITISIKSDLPQSIRYILTDDDGVKFYSAYQNNNINQLGEYQLMSFGAPVTVLGPPDEFTSTVIASKTIDASVVSDKLTATQKRIAESLEGLSRLSYIQSILGSPVDALPNSNKITDIEFQTRNTPIAAIDIGVVTAQVGLPGAITDVLIDNFDLQEIVVGQSEAEPEVVQGSIKRVVATQTGTDSQATGLLYAGLDSYYGDYNGFDTFSKTGVDFNGNNFFTFNQAGDQIVSITAARGFQVITGNGQITTSPLTTTSGSVVSNDAIAVDDFGVVYVADGPAGEIVSYIAANGQILNTTYGDVHNQSATVRHVLASGLPKVDDAVIVIGKTNIVGTSIVHEVIANFGGSWVRVNGQSAVQFANGPAARIDITTPRCCFGGNPPGPARPVAVVSGPQSSVTFGSSSAGNSITVDKPANPQPALPLPSSQLNQALTSAIQAELDQNFNSFNLYALDGDSIYLINQNNGSRTLYRELGEQAFGLRAHPRTKDLYYITNDRGSTPFSGTQIRRVDVSDLDPDNNNLPRIKTVYQAEDNEGIFGIVFGNSVPSDPTLQNQTLYALLSTLENQGAGQAVTTRLVEIAEVVFPPVPSSPISEEIPLNSSWSSTTSDGRLPGNPSKVIFSTLAPGGSCQMYYKQVEWYERGWRIGACCGALVELDGVYYIVAKRSIGIDLSCGGGESLSNQCIAQYINAGEGHPAIAWPTSEPLGPPPGGGGDEFLGIPTSGFVNFVKDENLSNSLLAKIQSGNALKTIGNPASEIPFILFPAT